MVKLECWDLFCITVEGRQFPSSCFLYNGEPAYSTQPISKGSEPNLKLLADMLRSETPIPQQVRNWLADMMDENAKSDFQFKKLSKRNRGAKINGCSVNWDIAEYALQLISEKIPRKNAISDAMRKYKKSKATVEAAIKSYNDACDEHSRMNLEEAIAADARAGRQSK